MMHELKCWPTPFEAVESGKKTHEVRKNDRPYKVGDLLRLREYTNRVCKAPDEPEWYYTGRELTVQVTYITEEGSFGLPPDVCVMSIRRYGCLT